MLKNNAALRRRRDGSCSSRRRGGAGSCSSAEGEGAGCCSSAEEEGAGSGFPEGEPRCLSSRRSGLLPSARLGRRLGTCSIAGASLAVWLGAAACASPKSSWLKRAPVPRQLGKLIKTAPKTNNLETAALRLLSLFFFQNTHLHVHTPLRGYYPEV